jgi:predicted nuclease with RNAse H fold
MTSVRKRYPVLPMTLGNMRRLGVRSIAVTCDLCHHQATLSADP